MSQGDEHFPDKHGVGTETGPSHLNAPSSLGNETTGVGGDAQASVPELVPSFKDVRKYGLGKPRRIILTGEIAHDPH